MDLQLDEVITEQKLIYRTNERLENRGYTLDRKFAASAELHFLAMEIVLCSSAKFLGSSETFAAWDWTS